MFVTLVRIGFFLLVPLGIWLLVKTIRFAKSVFYGKILLEIPFAVKQAPFTVAEAGTYAIWQKAEVFKRTPVDSFKTVIYHDLTNQQVATFPSFFRASMNNGSEGRMELATFSAAPGAYRLELQGGSSISGVEKALTGLLSSKPADTSKYRIQIRSSVPFYYKIVLVPLFILVGWLIIGGFIAGLLADRIAPALLLL